MAVIAITFAGFVGKHVWGLNHSPPTASLIEHQAADLLACHVV